MIYDNLKQRRENILMKWEDAALGPFSRNGVKPGRDKHDRFGNPVVYSISNGLSTIFDEIIGETHTARLDQALEDIVKIKSLQTERPSEAVAFLFGLKEILRDEWENLKSPDDLSGDIGKILARIDSLILRAFDIFMKCREKLYEIRSKEVLRRSYKLLERANMMAPYPQEVGDDDDESSR